MTKDEAIATLRAALEEIRVKTCEGNTSHAARKALRLTANLAPSSDLWACDLTDSELADPAYLRAYIEGCNESFGEAMAEIKRLRAEAAPVVAVPEEWMDELRELVSDFRKATYEFARGQDPSDHALMMERQGQIFTHVRKFAAPAAPLNTAAPTGSHDAPHS